jgi:hypothetical protein
MMTYAISAPMTPNMPPKMAKVRRMCMVNLAHRCPIGMAMPKRWAISLQSTKVDALPKGQEIKSARFNGLQ